MAPCENLHRRLVTITNTNTTSMMMMAQVQVRRSFPHLLHRILLFLTAIISISIIRMILIPAVARHGKRSECGAACEGAGCIPTRIRTTWTMC